MIETLTQAGRVHWGVMLAQEWKGELGAVGRERAWPTALEWADRAEELGFGGVWVFDHFLSYPVRDSGPVLEAWTTLAALSQVTTRVVLGTLVSCAAYREPSVTVRMAQNLQMLSGGRLCFGVGAGWDRGEFEAMGIPFGTAERRSDRLEEILLLARARAARWDRSRPGRSNMGIASAERRPLLLVGGDGEKRTLPSAVKYADLVNWQVGVRQFADKSRVLARLCEAAGRDPASLRRTHAPNFQLFESEREYARWRQHPDRGMSASDVETYVRDRGAFYGTSSAIQEMVEEFIDLGCQGFMVYCDAAPELEALEQLQAGPRVLPVRTGESSGKHDDRSSIRGIVHPFART
jgi:alkanesulfonate monooxygenase SsuD/methylene tetrahydromethanopterin reductase-like flavin-dependent oxidoreductase (luciferase family)